jgi:predicted PP-loop superfamily ATPase
MGYLYQQSVLHLEFRLENYKKVIAKSFHYQSEGRISHHGTIIYPYFIQKNASTQMEYNSYVSKERKIKISKKFHCCSKCHYKIIVQFVDYIKESDCIKQSDRIKFTFIF